MARKPRTNTAVETKPASVPDVQTAVSPDAVDQVVAKVGAAIDSGAIDAADDGATLDFADAGNRPRRPAVVLCMPVLFRAERPHNGQHDLAAMVTGIEGADPHGSEVVWLTVFPPRGEPFSVRAPEAADYDAPADGTWRFPF